MYVCLFLGSPSGSTPVDALLQGAVQLNSIDDKEVASHDVINTSYRKRTLMTAKNRVRMTYKVGMEEHFLITPTL